MTFTLKFEPSLVEWEFARREKRFFMYGAQDGQVAHCTNTGSMKGIVPGAKQVWVTPHDPASGRKLLFTAEMVRLDDGAMVGINTSRPNQLAAGAVLAGMLPELNEGTQEPGGGLEVRREVKFDAHTRFDLKVGETWVEVKNVTLAEGGVALFPDSVTERGAKHLRELQGIVERGGKALQLYMVQRDDCVACSPADKIDPAYGAALRAAAAAGVQVVALACKLTPEGITVDRRLPVVM